MVFCEGLLAKHLFYNKLYLFLFRPFESLDVSIYAGVPQNERLHGNLKTDLAIFGEGNWNNGYENNTL